MKTFVCLTDFSETATHATQYGYGMAGQIEANVVLCNAVLSPSESPQAGLSVWPVEETAVLLKDSTDKLNDLRALIGRVKSSSGFNPGITIINKPGTVEGIIHQIIDNEGVDLVVIGAHDSGILDTLLLGNKARNLIDETKKPLLLVPPSAAIAPVRKIAFATDLKNIRADMDPIYDLISLARPLKAEILLTHVHEGDNDRSPDFKQSLQNMVNELCKKSGYRPIHFKEFENASTGLELEQLCQNGEIDLLAMVHRSHNFIDRLFSGSQTQKMASHLRIPLLVFPAKPKPV